MKKAKSFLCAAAALAAATVAVAANPVPQYDPYVALEFRVGQPLGFMRSAPVNLGGGRSGFVLLFSEEQSIDPFEGGFFFPRYIPKLAVVDQQGKELWRKDLPNAVPGIWFIPVLPFDLDRDGIDEIYYVNNTIPGKPFNYDAYKLECVDSRTGELRGQWPWKAPYHNQANSYKWRFFLIGGYVKGEPVLVTTQGTYRTMALQAWNSGMTPRWQIEYPDDFNGPRGSHNTPVMDIFGDGIDQFMYGERCISFDTGRELFVLDGDTWYDHSDVIQPMYNRTRGEWEFFTTREKGDDGKLPRAVMFDQRGKALWAIDEMYGHFHYGWVGDAGKNGERIAMAGRYRLPEDPEGPNFVGRAYDAATGRPVEVSFPLNVKPFDFNGDGIHELISGNEGGNAVVYDNAGREIFRLGQGASILGCFKLLPLEGEQVMCCYPDGTVRIWADRNAKDTPEMRRRFTDRYYCENIRHGATGYNARFPILN